MTDTGMRLEAGSVVALRFHDLGRAVDVDSIAARITGDVERPQFPAGEKGGVRYERAPIELALDDVEIPLEDGRVFADASLRVFDFGIAVLALRVLVGGLDWDRFIERAEAIDAAVAGRARAWDEVEQRARAALGRAGIALQGDAAARHVFVIARRFTNAVPLDELVDGDYAASIVSRDWLPLTSIARGDLLRGARTAGSDLLVAGDERTFIVEATPGSGVPDVVEAALAQRACLDAVTGQRDRAAGDRAGRAAGSIRATRGLRLATLYATARDRIGLRDAEAGALRAPATGRTAMPWAALIAVAAATALLTTLVVLALI